MLKRVKELEKMLNGLWKQEEMFWGQRARVKWLKEGDQNPDFSMLLLFKGEGVNRIHRVKNQNGQWVDSQQQIHKVFHSF